MDPYEEQQERSRRQTFLGIFLSVLGLGFFTLTLIFLSGGLFFYVLLSCGGVGVLCLFNYVLWGRGFSEATAWEREEEELREQAARDDDWDVVEARRSDRH